MVEVYHSIDALIGYAERQLMLNKKDRDYVRNGILRLLGLGVYAENDFANVEDTMPEKLLANFTEACISAGLFSREEAEYYCDGVMGALMLSPSTVQSVFDDLRNRSDNETATTWFYDYSVKSDYVKKAKLDKNPRFEVDGLIITINKAKPEFRDPKKALSGNAVQGGYPKCSICHENEGYAGRSKRTLRTVDIVLNGESWFWQYSPYGYFNQHGIAVNYEHKPMYIDRKTFVRLMDFVDQFPHYFIGCNSPLERIGGSVLAHDHYQGGGEILPMHRANAAYKLKSKRYPQAIVEVLDWAGTVIRVVSKARTDIEEISEAIRAKWVSYEDKTLGIISKDENGVHNSISPTVVKTKRGYEMNIILRSNITSDDYPDGVFHAHPEYHIIKKESIGLIEAQGLFILPGRLEEQLDRLGWLIDNDRPLTKELAEFKLVYEEVKAIYAADKTSGVHSAIRKELGSVCARILDNTAVFKDRKQTAQFLLDLGFEI